MKLAPEPTDPDFKQQLRKTYDAHAAERDRAGEAAWRRPLCQDLISQLKSEQRDRLLEIGAGSGHTSKFFADHGLDVVAIDLSSAQVERCRAKGLTAYHRDFYDLGFRMESFDAIWAMNCLLHVPNRDLVDVLKGLRQVLNEGGVFNMGTWGGVAEEGINQQDAYEPPRFFALRTDDELVAKVSSVFAIEEFSRIIPSDRRHERLHMQFIRARKT